jgi:uncharacterized protein (TIGR02452 family)
MTQRIPAADAYKTILQFSQQVDIQEWLIEDMISTNKFFNNELLLAQKAFEHIQQEFFNKAANFPQEVSPSCQYFESKLTHFKKKLISLQSSGPTVPHAQFTNSIRNPAQFLHSQSAYSYSPTGPSPFVNEEPEFVSFAEDESPRISSPLSFSVENGGNNNQPALSPLQFLDRISYLLRNGKEAQALSEFSSLPPSIQQAVYEALWRVRGKPVGNNPIAHGNFGEVSFKGLDQRCQSTPQQKACAVELAKVHSALLEIVDAFENKKDQTLANQIFNNLPSQIQNEIYGKHWHEMGQPTDQSTDPNLKKIAHWDFGKVSFLGSEPRCDVPLDRKAQTIKAYLDDYRKKIDSLQDTIQTKQQEWTGIDKSSTIPGNQKNSSKIDTLDQLAKSIGTQFLDKSIPVVKPNPKGASFYSLTEAYVEAYPFLRPFFFQLVPTLQITNEAFPQGQIPVTGKPSQVAPPDLAGMGEKGRRSYRTAIMGETFETLNNGYYINSKGQKVVLDCQPSINSLDCQTQIQGSHRRRNKYPTQIVLDKKDCLTVTRDCANRGLNPIVLDAASDEHFGGGYKTGAGAQEENLCRRSGLCVAADPTLGPQKKDFYPLSQQGNYAGLYASHVPVFRGEEKDGYPYLDQPFETAVGIFAAPNFNPVHQQKHGINNPLITNSQGELRIPDAEVNEMKQKLRIFFQMAEKNGHQSVVLIPLGCGAFCNPPKHVCEIAMDVITRDFPNSFKEIHFSIIDDHNTGKAHNPRGNYVEFKETIENGFLKNGTLKAIGASFTENNQ